MKKLTKILLANFLLISLFGCQDVKRDLNDVSKDISIDQPSNPDKDKQKDDRNEDNKNKDDNNEDRVSLPTITHNNDKYQILSWSEFGMNWIDGRDYSVFSIAPPSSNLITQLIRKKSNGDAVIITGDVNISYQAVASLDGKYNTSSSNKTNFWHYASILFKANLEDDVGLKGNPVPTLTPAPMSYKDSYNWWSAESIPIISKDDDATQNSYPMVRVVAKDDKGDIIAETITVLPVSDETDCKKCHGSSFNYEAAKPTSGFVNDSDRSKDYRYNILRLHDQNQDITPYLDRLKDQGYEYQSSLEQTARNGTPILCAVCHKSNALKRDGFSDIKSLTSAMHLVHANVIDPDSGETLNSSKNKNACYSCHPGKETQSLRGAMSSFIDNNSSKSISCQNCHGGMSEVGNIDRDGWLDAPTCQHCHQNGERYTTVFSNPETKTLREIVDTRFATNTDTPIAGKSLYRFSVGHGGLSCSACHGSTHAIYGSQKIEDNIQSEAAQGHTGTIAECKTCHKYMPETVTGGPHGMHSIGVTWVYDHQAAVINRGYEGCKYCHGEDLNGTSLSTVFSKRRLAGKTFNEGHQVSCYDCHNGPTGIGY